MTASQTINEPTPTRALDAIGERERELTHRLATILERAPTRNHGDARQKLATALGLALENYEPVAPLENRIAQAGIIDETPPDIKAEPSQPRDEEPEIPEPQETALPHPDFGSTTLVKTARRARLRKGVKQAGAWVITFSVTAFIVGCVSIMLLGLPKTLDPMTWISATALDPAASTPAEKSSQPDHQTPPR